MTYADTTDVAASLGRDLTDDETARASVLLSRVEARIKQRITDLDDRVTSDPDYQTIVESVEADSVARVLRNPEGKWRESIDDYSYMRDRASSSGALEITRSEWGLLFGSGAAFSIDLIADRS